MDLVTVTCLRDYHEMMMQAESMQKFVDPCTHWVIVNDDDNIISQSSYQTFWKNSLEPYYENHTLQLLFPKFDIEDINVGWNRQQYYKLIIGEYIKDDYLILDSKNFFIKPCNINEWQGVLGCGLLRRSYQAWPAYKTLVHFADYFGTDVGPARLEALTPFCINYEDLTKLYPIKKTFLDIYKSSEKIRGPDKLYISEFQVYSTIIHKYKPNELYKLIENNIVRYRIIKKNLLLPNNPANTKSFEELRDHYDPSYEMNDVYFTDTTMTNVKCFAIHRMYAEQAKYDNIIQARKWIASLGFKNLFFPSRGH